MLNFWTSQHPLFGGFRVIPYMTVLSQVNDLDDQVFNTLPAQPPKKKTSTSPGKQKTKETGGEKAGQSSSSVQVEPPQKSDKAQYIESQQDHTPEASGVWTDMMKLPGTRRSNQVAEGFVSWLNKNYDCVIHEVNIYLFCSLNILYKCLL